MGGDITYLYTTEGWLYLAEIIDLHSRVVIGWSMNTRMTADLVCNVFKWRYGAGAFPKMLLFIAIKGASIAQGLIGISLRPTIFNRV